MKLKSFLMSFLMLFLPIIGLAKSPYGDDVVEIVIDKGGQLEKLLKKANALNTKKLSLISPERCTSSTVLSEKDFVFLSGMSQLEELYIDVDIDGNKFNTYKFKEKNGRLTNVNFPNLKKIGFGKQPRGEVKDLFYLKVPGIVVSGDDHDFPDGITFEDVYLISKPKNGVGGGNGANGFIDYNHDWLVLDADYYRDHYARLEDPYRLKVHSVHVSSRDWLDSRICELLNPAVIYLHTEHGVEKYLANYNSLLYDEDKNLNQYDGILSAALSNTDFSTLRLPDNQETIGDRFFNNVSVDEVDLNKVKTIGRNAFYGSHIKEIHIPSTVQDIDEKAFNNSELSVIYMYGMYPPAISVNYVPKGFEQIQFIIPKGARNNYDIGVWKKLRVLEDGASTNYAFDLKQPGTLSSMLTDDIKKSVVSLKLRGILYSDDIKLLEECPNLLFLDLGETFIAQSPKELKEKQETSDYLAGIFMNMGVIAQSEFEHDRMSSIDNLQVQYLAKLGEMAKTEKIEADPNCQVPILDKTNIIELILPLQLSEVHSKAFPKNLKKIVLPPDLKKFSASPYTALEEIVLPSSVNNIQIKSSNIKYQDLKLIDLSACSNPSLEIDAEFKNLQILKLPETYVPKYFNGSKLLSVRTLTPIEVYFNGRELNGYFDLSPSEGSTFYVPKGSRAGYSNLINKGYTVVEH